MNLTALRNHLNHVVERKPSELQKRSGNYRKGHVKIHGLGVTIENPKGSTREGISKDGVRWKSILSDHYGYIRGTVGNDGDHVDCYVGPDHGSNKIFVVDQKHHDTGKFDEHKVMLCYSGIESALKAYRAAFSDDHDRVLACTIMTVPKFKEWLRGGNVKRPLLYFKGHRLKK